IESGDQLHARGVGGGAAPAGLRLNADGTFWFEDGAEPAAFDVRVWDVNDATWGAWATQSIMLASALAGEAPLVLTPSGALAATGSLGGSASMLAAPSGALAA